MARLAAFVLLLLSLFAVAHSRVVDPIAVSDERDPPELGAGAVAEHSEPAIPTELVAVPLHRLAGPGARRDAGFSLRFPSHGRRHPCSGIHAHGNRWLARRHQGALVGGGFPGEARVALAAAVDWVREGPKHRRAEVAKPDPDPDTDSDSDDEGEEKMGEGWKKARKAMRKRFHHDEGDEEEMGKRLKKEMKRGPRHSHHHHHAEGSGVIKWFRDLVHF